MKDLTKKFLTSNDGVWRMARTIVQAILSFAIANQSAMAEWLGLDAQGKLALGFVCMSILSPLMSELGKYITKADAKNTEV